ncbi:hypothetical protein PCE1_001799 [Barthelona sp. PCE]
MQQNQEKVAQFLSVMQSNGCEVDPEIARFLLESSNWDIDMATIGYVEMMSAVNTNQPQKPVVEPEEPLLVGETTPEEPKQPEMKVGTGTWGMDRPNNRRRIHRPETDEKDKEGHYAGHGKGAGEILLDNDEHTITQYKNGILVDDKTFHDAGSQVGSAVLQKLRNKDVNFGPLLRRLFPEASGDVKVGVIDRMHEEYEEKEEEEVSTEPVDHFAGTRQAISQPATAGKPCRVRVKIHPRGGAMYMGSTHDSLSKLEAFISSEVDGKSFRMEFNGMGVSGRNLKTAGVANGKVDVFVL